MRRSKTSETPQISNTKARNKWRQRGVFSQGMPSPQVGQRRDRLNDQMQDSKCWKNCANTQASEQFRNDTRWSEMRVSPITHELFAQTTPAEDYNNWQGHARSKKITLGQCQSFKTIDKNTSEVTGDRTRTTKRITKYARARLRFETTLTAQVSRHIRKHKNKLQFGK